MKKIDEHFKNRISSLTKTELENLVIKAALSNSQFYNYLYINFIEQEDGENELYEKAKQDMKILFYKSYKGISDELRTAGMLAACNKRINEFSKVCKNKALELDLILHVLEIPFSQQVNSFGTCFTRFNYQVYLLVKRAITLLNSKLHKDYRLQYAPKLNEYLQFLHRHSNHLDYIYALPQSI